MGAQQSVSQGPNGSRPFQFIIIGETGAGKTSFLNYLCNLPRLCEFTKEAKNRGADVDIEGFTLRKFHSETNECGGLQKFSQTNKANVYPISGFSFQLKAIDTPGLGDSRGPMVDDEHLQTIEDCVVQQTHINAICVVVNGKMPRATPQIQCVLSRLTTLLPKDVCKRIIVVYTRVETWDDLEFDISTLEENIGTAIPEEHQFCFDNPYALLDRKLASASSTKGGGKGKGQMDAKSVRKIVQKFADSNSDIAELFAQLRTFEPVEISVFKDLFSARHEIETAMSDLKLALDKVSSKIQKIAEARDELRNAQDWKAKYDGFCQDELVEEWVKKPSDKLNLVCQTCHALCHYNCEIEKGADSMTWRKCLCFTNQTTKTIRLFDSSDRDALIRHSSSTTYSVYGTEDLYCRNKLRDEKKLSISSNVKNVFKGTDGFTLEILGKPDENEGKAYLPPQFTHSANGDTDVTHQTLCNLCLPANVNFYDWSGMLEGSRMPCSHCKCPLSAHGQGNYTWHKEQRMEPKIDKAKQSNFLKFQGQENEKQRALDDLSAQQTTLESQKIGLEQQLRQALRNFKEKSTVSSYSRVLSKQRDFLDYMIEVTRADKNLNPDDKRSRVQGLQNQQKLLDEAIHVVTGSEE